MRHQHVARGAGDRRGLAARYAASVVARPWTWVVGSAHVEFWSVVETSIETRATVQLTRTRTCQWLSRALSS